MKVWMPNPWYYSTDAIPSVRRSDEIGFDAVKKWISPTREDPAVLIPSDRSDGYEEIKWHGEVHLVYSIDLEHEK